MLGGIHQLKTPLVFRLIQRGIVRLCM